VASDSYTLEGIGGEGEALDLLVRRAQDGEEAAFEELLSRFEGRALAIATQLGLPREDAEDVAQEAFLKLFRHIGSYQTGRRFTAYFYRIVVNETRDRGRRLGAEPRPPASPAGDAGADPRAQEIPSSEPAPDASLVEAERRDEVRRALLQLSDREREVIILRDLQGLSTWQVARILKLNPITVRRHAMQARARLREILGG
jgi:RNA polymerase sigma-70 factor, ECF subfamily